MAFSSDARSTPAEASFGNGPDRLLEAARVRLGLAEPVGVDRPNRLRDVATVEALLRASGDVAASSNRPTGLFSGFLRDATRRFQRRNGLSEDGVVNPDGETFGALVEQTQFPGAPELDPVTRARCDAIQDRIEETESEIRVQEGGKTSIERTIRTIEQSIATAGRDDVVELLQTELEEARSRLARTEELIDLLNDRLDGLETQLAECLGITVQS